MNRRLTALALCAVMTVCCGCTSWEDAGTLDELSQFYQQENQEPEPSPLTAFTLPYVAGETLDPLTTTDPVQQTLDALLYEGLFALNEHFTPEPLLAETYTYDAENRIWVITLRADAVFSDGTQVTVQDAAASLRRAMTSQRYASRLECISSVSAWDDTLVIYLSEDVATLPARLDIPIVKAGTEGYTAPVGSGPYVFTRTEEGVYLAANSRWWQGRTLPLDRIELLHCKDQDSALYAFSSREVQLLSLDLTGTSVTAVSVNGDYTDAPTTAMQYIGVNARREALADSALRQTLSAGIDRQALVSSCLLGHGQAAQLPASPASPDYDTSLETAYSAADYRQRLADVLGDETLSLTLLVNEENSFKVTAAQEIAFSLTTEQLTVTVEAVPWEQFTERLLYGDFDLYYGECRLTSDWDVSALVSSTGGLNYGGWESEATDALLSGALSADNSHRAAALDGLWRDLLENAPFLPLCFKSNSVLVTEGVIDGLSPTETNAFCNMDGWTVTLDA